MLNPFHFPHNKFKAKSSAEKYKPRNFPIKKKKKKKVKKENEFTDRQSRGKKKNQFFSTHHRKGISMIFKQNSQ